MPKLETRNSKIAESINAPASQIRDFQDLQVWQLGRALRMRIYDLIRKLPPEERYALAAQVRRAAISITANIAEGFGRYSYQENIQFCRQARGSAYEVRDHLIAARDQGCVTVDEYRQADSLAQRVIRTLNGYIRSTQERRKEQSERNP